MGTEYEQYKKYIGYLNITIPLDIQEWQKESIKTKNIFKQIVENDVVFSTMKQQDFSNNPVKFHDEQVINIRKDYVKIIQEVCKLIKPNLPLKQQFELLRRLNIEPKHEINLILTSGLGNRMFQLASVYSICKQHNYRLNVISTMNTHTNNNYEFILMKFNIMSKIDYSKVLIKECKDFVFDIDNTMIKSILNNETCNLLGYFQCSKYFNNNRLDILDMFEIPSNIDMIIKKKYKNLEGKWFIHVRLGDYLSKGESRDVHYIDLSEYYITSMKHIPSDDEVYMFSDDTLKNIRKYYPCLSNYTNIKYINEPDELISLYVMSKCAKGGICANSTFSWWAGYLNTNENKKIFVPPKFINGYEGNFNL